jgi:hypothetical protein
MSRCQRECHRFDPDILLQQHGDIMTEETTPVPLTFKEQWEQKKLLKRAKKKAKHNLQSQGFGRREASTAVNKAVNNLAKKPMKKSAGRGR